MNVEYRLKIDKDGQMASFYCVRCHKELSTEFYNGSDVRQLIGTYNCSHYHWIFVGDYYLDPPRDKETKEILDTAIAKVDTNGGKYFLLPTYIK